MRLILASVLILIAAPVATQSPLVELSVDGKPLGKRYVLRLPQKWNQSLVIGAHGGGGGNNFDRKGNVIGTDETALDDVIGRSRRVLHTPASTAMAPAPAAMAWA
jgi:hypothetical protein